MKRSWIFHDSHESFYRNPFGAVSTNEKITIRLKVYFRGYVDSVILRMWKEAEGEERIPMKLKEETTDEKIYEVEFRVPPRPTLLWYYFIVNYNGKTYYYGNNSNHFGGVGEVREDIPPSYQITVFKENTSTPNWFKEAVMYQIFPDRFYNGYNDGSVINPKKNSFIYGNWEDTPVYLKDPETGRIIRWEFFGGNLLGVMKKLPYLKELGVNVIYFNPIFEAPSNHRYDIADYKKVDSMLGDNLMFKELCRKARDMGIRIILDGVFSHTGSDSIYFNKEGKYPGLGAYQSKESPYYSWYRFEEYPEKYDSWWGIDTLPNVNETEPSYQDFIIHDEDSVLRYWMSMGVKGWRLDVVDELPGEFVKEFRKVMKEMDGDSILIGEVWEDASNKISYGERRQYLLGDELDSVMNYPFRKILLDYFLGRKGAEYTHRALMHIRENYPTQHFYSTMNLIGSHDVPRVLTLLGEAPEREYLSQREKEKFRLSESQKKLAIDRLKLMVLFQMTFPGVPCIYYGDEAGLEGYDDPLNRRTYPWDRENHELLNWYKTVVSIRNRYDLFRTGEWIPFHYDNDIYGYIRRINGGKDVFDQPKQDGTAIVLFNRSKGASHTLHVNIGKWFNGRMIDLLNNGEEIVIENGELKVDIGPLEGKLYVDRV